VLMMMMLVLKVLIDAFCTLQDCCTNAFSLRQVVGLIYTYKSVHNIGSDSQEAATCSICGCALPAFAYSNCAWCNLHEAIVTVQQTGSIPQL